VLFHARNAVLEKTGTRLPTRCRHFNLIDRARIATFVNFSKTKPQQNWGLEGVIELDSPLLYRINVGLPLRCALPLVATAVDRPRRIAWFLEWACGVDSGGATVYC
jgi:hypothetical protein